MLKSSMILGLQNLETHLGFDLEIILIIAFIIPTIIFFAKDFRLGVIMFTTFNGLLTMFFIAMEWSYKVSLVLTFVGIILLCFSLYFLQQSKTGGSII